MLARHASSRLIPLAEIDAATRSSVAGFFDEVCPMPAGHYEERLSPHVYDLALLFEREPGALSSVQLLNDFVEGDRRHIYLGPMVSRRQGYVSMLIESLTAIGIASERRAMTLMAEAQNPSMALAMLYVFDGSAAPRLKQATWFSDETIELVRAYAKRLHHIHDINWQTLSSQADVSMYRSCPDYAQTVAWFKARGIDFAAGAGLIVVVDLAADPKVRAGQVQRALERAQLFLGSTSKAQVRRTLQQWFDEQTQGSH